MKKIIILIAFTFLLTSCTSITEKIPKLERKTCDGTNKTLTDVLCKKD